ncbi:hypothetical protein DFJ77DRAFT_53558 [Powellomyces hirtus]|nr:hypothetical protein DFJ77DRAFT_53558 [Powellomyces hirtus]
MTAAVALFSLGMDNLLSWAFLRCVRKLRAAIAKETNMDLRPLADGPARSTHIIFTRFADGSLPNVIDTTSSPHGTDCPSGRRAIDNGTLRCGTDNPDWDESMRDFAKFLTVRKSNFTTPVTEPSTPVSPTMTDTTTLFQQSRLNSFEPGSYMRNDSNVLESESSGPVTASTPLKIPDKGREKGAEPGLKQRGQGVHLSLLEHGSNTSKNQSLATQTSREVMASARTSLGVLIVLCAMAYMNLGIYAIGSQIHDQYWKITLHVIAGLGPVSQTACLFTFLTVVRRFLEEMG